MPTLIDKDTWVANVLVLNLTDQPQRLEGGKLLLLAQPVAAADDSVTPNADADTTVAMQFLTVHDGRYEIVDPAAIPTTVAELADNDSSDENADAFPQPTSADVPTGE